MPGLPKRGSGTASHRAEFLRHRRPHGHEQEGEAVQVDFFNFLRILRFCFSVMFLPNNPSHQTLKFNISDSYLHHIKFCGMKWKFQDLFTTGTSSFLLLPTCLAVACQNCFNYDMPEE